MNTLAAEIAQCLLIDCWNRTAALVFQLQPANDSTSGSSPSTTQPSTNRRHTSFRIADILADTNDDVNDDDSSDPRTVGHLEAERDHAPGSTNPNVKPTRCSAKSAGFNCNSVPALEGYAGHFRYGGRRFRRFSSSAVNSRSIISPLTALYRMTKDNFDVTNVNGQGVPPDFAEGGIDAVLQQCTELGKPGGLSSTRSRHHQPASEIFSPASTASATNSVPEPALSAGSMGKKRRKSRTAFTGHQLRELERRFARQKYLLPADRDATARDLGLTNAQVITWFQNRRAKLKRDLDELRADVNAARNLLTDAPETVSSVADSSSVSVRSSTSHTSNTSSVHSTEKGNVYGL